MHMLALQGAPRRQAAVVISLPDSVATRLRPCNFEGCQHFATGAICLLVPYEGHAVPSKGLRKNAKQMEPLKLFLGIEVCAAHGKAAKLDDFVKPEMVSAVVRAAIEFGRPKPEFSRAIVGGTALDDPDYIRFKAHQEATKRLAKTEGTA